MLNRRYPGRLELRAPQETTLITLRMQAQTAARYEDVLAHAHGDRWEGQPSGPPFETRPEHCHPQNGQVPAGAPPTSDALLAFRRTVG